MDIRTTLIDLAVKEFNCQRGALRDDLPIGELGLDSLAMIEFVFRIEELCGVRIENEQLDRLGTLSDLVRLVEAARRLPVR